MADTNTIKPTSVFSWLLTAILIFGCRMAPTNSDKPNSAASTLPIDLVWYYDTEGAIARPPYYADGTVYVFTDNNRLHAINASDGTLRWVQKVQGTDFQYNNVFYKDKVILVRLNRFLEIRSAEDGEIIWRKELDARAVAAGNDKVFVAIGRHGERIEAYELTSGELLWKFSKKADSRNGSRIFYDLGTKAVISLAVILEAETGRLKSTFDIYTNQPLGFTAETQARYANGNLFYGPYVYDVYTNKLLFDGKNYSTINKYLLTSLVDNVHFLYGNDGLIALDTTDFTTKWIQYRGHFDYFSLEPKIVSNVTIFNEAAYLIFSDATLRALDLDDGREIGRWQAHDVVSSENEIIPGLARSAEMLFVTLGKNRLYAFGRQ